MSDVDNEYSAIIADQDFGFGLANVETLQILVHHKPVILLSILVYRSKHTCQIA